MIVAETAKQVRTEVSDWKKKGFTVGLVPTMELCMKDTLLW